MFRCRADTGFVLSLLERLEAELCVDPRHIHATGFSHGGIMAYEVATGPNHGNLSSRFASIVPVAG